jgi:UDP-2,3-diacylglucosamine pyrophosphatase LpxH
MKYKTISISDIHIFRNDSLFKDCFEFLKNNPCDKLILNGDIFDVFALMRKEGNYKKHKYIIKEFLQLMRERKPEIIYVIGNHDYWYYLLKFIQPILKIKIKKFYNFESNDITIHATHGDWIPLILKIKKLFKKTIVVTGVDDDDYMTYGISKKCDILLCGHTHKPIIIKKNNFTYLNSGDWVGHKTAAVEKIDGEWDLITIK